MSAIDEFDLNQKLHFLLMDPLEITDPLRQQKSLNGSVALSHPQLLELLALFQLTDVNRRDLANLDHIWAVYQGVRKDHVSGEYRRDQISILINIGNTHTTRIYIRPLRNSNRDAVLRELEALRNPAELMAYLGDLTQAMIHRRGGQGGKRPRAARHGVPIHPNKPKVASDDVARHRPFEGLRTSLTAAPALA